MILNTHASPLLSDLVLTLSDTLISLLDRNPRIRLSWRFLAMEDDSQTFRDGLLIWKDLVNKGISRSQLPLDVKILILRAIRNNDIVNWGAGDQHIKTTRQNLFATLGLNDPNKDVRAATDIKKKIMTWMDNQILQLKKDHAFKIHSDFMEWADYTTAWLHNSWNG